MTMVAGLAASSMALACSGPGAEAAMRRAEVWGWGLWGVCLLLAVGATVRGPGRRWVRASTSMVFVALHPGLWVSARQGDCGSLRLALSVAVTVAFAAWVVVRIVAASRKPVA